METKEYGNSNQEFIKKLAYLAGIIDGEGTIGIYYNKKSGEYRARFYVVNTSKKLIDWLVDNFGGLVYSRINKKHLYYKKKWEWVLMDKKMDEILESVIPYLVIKSEQAKIVLLLRKTISRTNKKLDEKIISLRKRFYNQIRELNK